MCNLLKSTGNGFVLKFQTSVKLYGRFGIFPSWGLSQKLQRTIGVNKAREVSLTATPLTAEEAEKRGLVNHVVERDELLNKAREVAVAILKNNQDLVLRYKSVINDGAKLDLGHALELEKVLPLINSHSKLLINELET